MKVNEQQAVLPQRATAEDRTLSFQEGLARLIRRARQLLRVSSREEYNERVVYAEVIWQALAGAGGMSFVTIFLVRLGAPSWLVGLYTSLPALMTTLAVLPAGTFVQRQRNLVRTVNISRLIFRSAFASFALLTFLPAAIAPYVLVAARSLISVPGAVLNVAVTTLWGRVTTPRRRPRMLSTRLALHGLFAAIVGFAAGQWLERVPYPLNYQVLFATVLLAGLGSVLTLSRLRLPETTELAPLARKKAGLRELLPMIQAAPDFRHFMIAAFVFRMGMNLPMALFPILRVRVVGATDAWIGILFTVERILSVLAYFVVGSLASKPKQRRLLWLACVGVGFFPITMALSFTPTMLLIPQVIAGLLGPGMDIFMTDTLFRVSPEDRRPAFVAANTFLANLIAFIGPLLGTALSDLVGIRFALVIAGALRIAGGLVFWRMGVGGSRERPHAA
ncbi:MAG: MFS transporter [Chloroflexi bacterium]|nr:MFS transporter [Chloroflexota bacterium]